jgi:hypothetical protein
VKTCPRIGTKVRYSSAFCRSVGFYTGDIPFARGTVVGSTTFPSGATIVDVEWDEEVPGYGAISLHGVSRINVANLWESGTWEPN